MNELSDLTDAKLVKVLEYFLSLHEADIVYNCLFNDKVTPESITELLDKYHAKTLGE